MRRLPPALQHRDFRLFWTGAVVSAVNSIFVIGGPRLGQVESGVVAAFGGAPFSAFTGGIGALLVVLGIALVPGVRRFSLGEEPRTSLA